MIALMASSLVIAYLLVPGALFRIVFSLFIPLRQFQLTRIQEIRYSTLTSLIPFVLALILHHASYWYSHYPFPDVGSAGGSQDHKLVFSVLNSTSGFETREDQFWHAFDRTIKRHSRVLLWFYIFVVSEALALGFVSKQYRHFHDVRLFGRLSSKILLSNISEWYVLFELNAPKNSLVEVDILTLDDKLYKGKVGNHFSDKDGNLTGILLKETQRFDRNTYLKDGEAGRKVSPDNYWKRIPGQNLYVFANRIGTININYEGGAVEQVKEILRDELKLSAKVSIAEQGSTKAKTSSEDVFLD